MHTLLRWKQVGLTGLVQTLGSERGLTKVTSQQIQEAFGTLGPTLAHTPTQAGRDTEVAGWWQGDSEEGKGPSLPKDFLYTRGMAFPS
jgi:hypothetical protein